MKKILMLLLGAMLVLSMAGVVSAETTATTFTEEDFASEKSKTVDMTVTLVLEEAYEVTIPADIELTEQKDGEVLMYSGYNWLNATVHLMKPDEGLYINITSNNVENNAVSKEWTLDSTTSDSEAKYIIGYTTAPTVHIDENSLTLISENKQVLGIKEAGKKAELCMHYKLITPVSTLSTETYTDTLTFGVYILPTSEIENMGSAYLKSLSAA